MTRSALVATAIGLIVISTALIAGRLMVTRSYFAQPNAATYLFAIAGILLVYGVAALTLTPRMLPARGSPVSVIFAFGTAAGLVEVAAIAIENSVLIPTPGAILAPGVMAAVFGSWAVAGYVSMRRLGTARLAIAAPIASAMLCMLVAVAFGLALQMYVLFGNAEVAAWAEYKRSGWTDPVAFQIANTLELACDHLLFGPFAAAVVGSAGVSIASLSRRPLRIGGVR